MTVDPRLLALLEEPVAAALRKAAGATVCHLVGGVLRDRLLGLDGYDLDAVVAARGREIGERLAGELPARLVVLGGGRFAAFRLVGAGFTLDLWDRGAMSLDDDLARRDFTVNAFAIDLVTRELSDPFDGLGDLGRRRLRATTPRVFRDDPLRVLRLVRLALQLPGFRAEPGTAGLARAAAPGLAVVAAERVRVEAGRILAGRGFAAAFDQLVDLELYPGLLIGRPGEPGGSTSARQRLARLEPALERLCGRSLAHGRLSRAAARLAVLFSALPGAEEALDRYRRAGYLAVAEAALCRRLLGCRQAPAGEPAARWFLHRWGEHWPTALATLAALAEPPLEEAGWRRLAAELARLAETLGEELFAPRPLLDGHQIQELLEIGPGPRLGGAARRLRRAQVEGRVRDRAAAERLLRSSPSGAD